MIKFIIPAEEYLQSYKEAFDEYVSHNVTTYHFDDASSYDVFAKFDRYRHEDSLPPNRVTEDKYWLVDDEKAYFIGEVGVRHRLNGELYKHGGHIGYGVRCSEWGRGYGTALLAFALDRLKELGVTTAQITCNDDNKASARVIEKNGFTLIDKPVVSKDGKDVIIRRYRKTLT